MDSDSRMRSLIAQASLSWVARCSAGNSATDSFHYQLRYAFPAGFVPPSQSVINQVGVRPASIAIARLGSKLVSRVARTRALHPSSSSRSRTHQTSRSLCSLSADSITGPLTRVGLSPGSSLARTTSVELELFPGGCSKCQSRSEP